MKQDKAKRTIHQSASAILMVRPAAFGYNAETATSNSFQHNNSNESSKSIQEKALAEFDALVQKLKDHNIYVILANDTLIPIKPDAVFPNNWISTHSDGTLITYPMQAVARRLERRDDIIELISNEFIILNQYSFDHYEEEEKYLEGTGSMILDRINHIVYACISPRTDLELLEHFALLGKHQKIIFHATDPLGKSIYHTNVIMAIGQHQAILCLDCIQDESEQENIIQSLKGTNKEIIEIAWVQVLKFAGNMLQVRNQDGESFWVMSQSAYDSLNIDQIKKLNQHSKIISCPIPTIEWYGGGSVRCMIAEIFLEKKQIKP